MPRGDSPDPLLLTATEAGQRLSMTTQQVVVRLREGRILGHREEGRWLVRIDDLPDPPPREDAPRPIVLHGSENGWLAGSVDCGDRAPRREQPPEEPPLEAAWRIVRPADPPPEDPSA